MKSFFSFLDTGFIKYVPQPLQHVAVANKAANMGGGVTFSTGEDLDTLVSQGVLRSKIEEKPAIDGLVFFSVRQFFYGGDLNIKLLGSILDGGYEIHFARENFSILTKEELDDAFPMLYSTRYLLERDEPRSYWQPVWDWLSKEQRGHTI